MQNRPQSSNTELINIFRALVGHLPINKEAPSLGLKSKRRISSRATEIEAWRDQQTPARPPPHPPPTNAPFSPPPPHHNNKRQTTIGCFFKLRVGGWCPVQLGKGDGGKPPPAEAAETALLRNDCQCLHACFRPRLSKVRSCHNQRRIHCCDRVQSHELQECQAGPGQTAEVGLHDPGAQWMSQAAGCRRVPATDLLRIPVFVSGDQMHL